MVQASPVMHRVHNSHRTIIAIEEIRTILLFIYRLWRIEPMRKDKKEDRFGPIQYFWVRIIKMIGF
jgi:hypothetical protein